METLDWLVQHYPFLAPLLDNELLIGLAVLALTAAATGLGVPGTLVPISFSSGALLGGWLGAGVVVTGALLGSLAFFAVTRLWLAGPARRRFGTRLARFDEGFAKRGFAYLLGLRLVGVPHVLVTAASALSAIRPRSFALATLLGFLPAVALSALAGSAV